MTAMPIIAPVLARSVRRVMFGGSRAPLANLTAEQRSKLGSPLGS